MDPSSQAIAGAGVLARLRQATGSLFWKIFLVVGLVQTVSMLGVSVFMEWDRHHGESHRDQPHPGEPRPGEPFGRAPGPPGPVQEAAPTGPDLGPREGPRDDPRDRGDDAQQDGHHEDHRQDHHEDHHHEGPGEGRPGQGLLHGSLAAFGLHIPLVVVTGSVLTSLASAALLAWWFSRPIRRLREGLARIASGQLDTRLSRAMGHSGDEFGDLGADFDRMAARLQDLVGAQRRLLHDVSHELRSPLARVRAAIGLARQARAGAPDAPGALDRIDRECVRMDRLIGELLAISRLESGVTGRALEEIDLAELLGVIIDDASFEASAVGRKVLASSLADASVRGDVELLRRAIENVVRNAIKFSPEGGVVLVGSHRDGDRVEVIVDDQGDGIAEADRERVFEPFYRGAATPGQDGHGLGLTIARSILAGLGGTITLGSRPGSRGLRVCIGLPVSAGAGTPGG